MEFVESQRSREDLQTRIRTLEHQLEVERANCRQLEQDKRVLKQACVSLQQHAEEDEEHISNSLFRRIRDLEKEKATLEETGGDTKGLLFQLETLKKEKVCLAEWCSLTNRSIWRTGWSKSLNLLLTKCPRRRCQLV